MIDDLLLTDRVVVVTGASNGIGLATARRAIELGARVAALDIADGPDDLSIIRCDVSRAEDVARAFAEVNERFGPVEVLVNNAGVVPPGKFVDLSYESFQRTVRINLDGAFLCSTEAVAQMRSRGGGSIVNVSSQAGRHRSIAGDIAYASSKGALLPFTRQLAYELADASIRVNCVCPGAIHTGVHDRTMRPEDEATMVAAIPLKRMAEPGEVAAVICFLASDGASFVNGAIVDVNGGVL
jgi:NAD(P)-dependent dehydrogenase (short-subunit alcohol dehydrogenase family)